MSVQRELEDVVDCLRRAKAERRSCALLIGAGCSVTANIPTANQFVEEIRKHHPRAYERAKTKTYAECMGQLSEGNRRQLICQAIDQAKINWAHIGIAQLIAHGYIDRVLTTNFDPLIVRACAMVGRFPAVYDVVASPDLNLNRVSDPSVFYLHGRNRSPGWPGQAGL